MFNFTIIIILFFFSKLESKNFVKLMNLITLLIKSLNVEGEKLYLEHSVFFQKSLIMITNIWKSMK